MDRKVDDNQGAFSGYASVFNVTDAHQDVVAPGAFRDTLAQWKAKGTWPKLLWQHEAETPIGRITHLREDPHGLYVEGILLLDVPKGREAYVLLENGVLDGLSIGFKTLRQRLDKNRGVRVLEKINLVEISFVTFPANDQAGVSQVKARQLEIRLNALRLALNT